MRQNLKSLPCSVVVMSVGVVIVVGMYQMGQDHRALIQGMKEFQKDTQQSISALSIEFQTFQKDTQQSISALSIALSEFQTRSERTIAAAESSAVALISWFGTHAITGCGTLVTIGDRSFIATAAHVITRRYNGTTCLASTISIEFLNGKKIQLTMGLNSVELHDELDIALIPLRNFYEGGVPIHALSSSDEMLGVAAYRRRDRVEPFYINARKRQGYGVGRIAADMQGAPGFSGSGLLQSSALVAIHVSSRTHPFELNESSSIRLEMPETPGIDYANAEKMVKLKCFGSKVDADSCITSAIALSQLHARNPSTVAVLASELLPSSTRMNPAIHQVFLHCQPV